MSLHIILEIDMSQIIIENREISDASYKIFFWAMFQVTSVYKMWEITDTNHVFMQGTSML